MTTFAEVEHKELDGVSIITFTGEIDETNADDIFRRVYELFSGKNVIFNFSGLVYGNSKFLGYIAAMYRYIEEKDGMMVICECQSNIYEMFDMAGIFIVIPVVKTLAEALIKIGIPGHDDE